jgi:hypothetical protein
MRVFEKMLGRMFGPKRRGTNAIEKIRLISNE